MQKSLNLLIIVIIFTFFWFTYKYYSSYQNVNIKNFNRNNINQIISKKISNLPVLFNDTNNVIEFNNSIAGEINNDKPRSFWKLLKSK